MEMAVDVVGDGSDGDGKLIEIVFIDRDGDGGDGDGSDCIY